MNTFVCDNGLQVLLLEENDNNITIGFVVGTGLYDDPTNKNELAHIIEHILFCGTQVISPNDFLDFLDSTNTYYNAITDQDKTYYKFIADDTYGLQLLDIILYMITSPLLTKKNVETEKHVVHAESLMRLSEDNSILIDDIMKVLLNDEKLEAYYVTKKQYIKNINTKDVIKFWEKYYVPSNIILYIQGNFNSRSYTKIIKEHMKIFPNKYNIPSHLITRETIRTQINKNISIQKNMNIHVYNRNTPETFICFMFGLIDPLYLKMKHEMYVLQTALGDGLGSILLTELRRQNAYTYSVDVYTEICDKYVLFQICYYTDIKNTNKSINELLRITQRIKSKGLTIEELERAVNLIYNKDINDEDIQLEQVALNMIYNRNYVHKTNRPNKKWINKIELNKINDMSKKLFDTDKLNVLVYGNHSSMHNIGLDQRDIPTQKINIKHVQ
jgi:predicted Zn-dependent peptidase